MFPTEGLFSYWTQSLIPGLGGSPGEGNGNPLYYSCLEKSMDREAWWAIVHGSQRIPQLSDKHLDTHWPSQWGHMIGCWLRNGTPAGMWPQRWPPLLPAPIPGLVLPMDSSQESSVWLLVPVPALTDCSGSHHHSSQSTKTTPSWPCCHDWGLKGLPTKLRNLH